MSKVDTYVIISYSWGQAFQVVNSDDIENFQVGLLGYRNCSTNKGLWRVGKFLTIYRRLQFLAQVKDYEELVNFRHLSKLTNYQSLQFIEAYNCEFIIEVYNLSKLTIEN